MKFKTIDHTADIGIEVEGDSLEDLFEGAALGMVSLMFDPSEVGHGLSRELTVCASDIVELLFKWLNEILFIIDTEGILLSDFRIIRIQDDILEGEVSGDAIDPGRHHISGEVKAATMHQMRVEKQDRGWFARVIFDV